MLLVHASTTTKYFNNNNNVRIKMNKNEKIFKTKEVIKQLRNIK